MSKVIQSGVLFLSAKLTKQTPHIVPWSTNGKTSVIRVQKKKSMAQSLKRPLFLNTQHWGTAFPPVEVNQMSPQFKYSSMTLKIRPICPFI